MAKPSNPYKPPSHHAMNGHLLKAVRGSEYYRAIGKIGGRVSAERSRVGAHRKLETYVTDATVNELRALRAATGLSVSAIVREALTFYLQTLQDDRERAEAKNPYSE